MKSVLENFFSVSEHQTSIEKEILAGVTTFITMAYIIFVNPQMMAQAGMDYGAIFVGTCLAAAVACLFMGLFANWPVGLAPGMGLNAFFTYTVVGEMGYSWEVALGAVFIAGILFFIMSITPLRRWMLDSIPLNLRIAMGAGVGLFIGFIGQEWRNNYCKWGNFFKFRRLHKSRNFISWLRVFAYIYTLNKKDTWSNHYWNIICNTNQYLFKSS